MAAELPRTHNRNDLSGPEDDSSQSLSSSSGFYIFVISYIVPWASEGVVEMPCLGLNSHLSFILRILGSYESLHSLQIEASLIKV